MGVTKRRETLDQEFEYYKKYEIEVIDQAKKQAQKKRQSVINYSAHNEELKKQAGLEFRTPVFQHLANIHLQVRVKAEVQVNVMNKMKVKELRVSINGLDISFCSPTGPIAIKAAALLKKVSIDIFYHGKDIQGSFDRKKRSIFDKVEGTVRVKKILDNESELNLPQRKQM